MIPVGAVVLPVPESPELAVTSRYWVPFNSYIDGDPDVGPPSGNSETCVPVALS
jgi:hypothetical protein